MATFKSQKWAEKLLYFEVKMAKKGVKRAKKGLKTSIFA